MVQLISGVVLLILGVVLLVRGFLRGRDETAGQQGGFIGRLGALMVGLVLAFLGAALLLPAREATPVGGANTNPVDEAVEESGGESGEAGGE